LFFCFVQKNSAQCFTVTTNPNYNCVTSVCEITITILNSTISPPYTITSTPAGINGIMSTNTFVMTNIPFQTTYNIFITGSGACTGFGQVLYSNPTLPLNITVTQTNICFGANNGAASAVFAGVGPFSWSWSTGSNNPSVSGLTAGVYNVSITDSRNCTATKPFTITSSPQITSQLTATVIPCAGATISSAVTSTGGTGPYTYTLNGNPITSPPGNIATNISPGLQTIVTKDSQGCVQTNTQQLNTASQQTITPTVTIPNCPHQSNGAISVSVNGPVAGYTYTWNPGSSNSSNLTNVPAGNYTLNVLDASNCITRSVITVPPASSITPVFVVHKENCSAVDGAFTVNPSGGHPPYTYTILPGNVNGNNVTGLSSGNYTTIIGDTHGCIDSALIYVGNLSTVSLNILTVTAVDCYNACNGSVILNIQNAVQPVTYSITGMPMTTNTVISNLCAGFYVVKALDNIGCPAFDTLNFLNPAPFSFSVAPPNSICIGKKAFLTAEAHGGTGALSYFWNPGSLTGQTVSVSPLVTTVYSLNVYDSKGCTLPPYQVIVKVNPEISINVNNSSTGICPGTTAQITPTVTGGDGNYTYLWLPGNSKGSDIFVENITIPTYTLIVNDACGSPATAKEITIKIHPIIQPLYKQEHEGDGCMPYCTRFTNTTPLSRNAIWNFGDKPYEQMGDTTKYCYEKAGNFNLRLTVTDSNSCKASFTYTNAIQVLVRPGASYITDPEIITLNDADNVLIKNTTDNGSLFKWYINGEYLGTKQNINYTFKDTGCYDIKLIAENENSCKDSTIRSICVFEGFNFYMPNAFTPNNDGVNDKLLPKGTGWLYDNYKFEIYNRWGLKVFSTGNVFEGWDGGAKTDPYALEVTKTDPNDVYGWRTVVTDNMNQQHVLKGFVTVVR